MHQLDEDGFIATNHVEGCIHRESGGGRLGTVRVVTCSYPDLKHLQNDDWGMWVGRLQLTYIILKFSMSGPFFCCAR